MLDIEKAFNPETKSVYAHYQRPGVGFYIPLYQREYSWDNDNIDQLLDDVARGVENVTENPKSEIRFLGTIIAVKISDERKIYPIDRAGLPSTIENIIDGQQRLSTIALFSTLLYKHIHFIQERIKPKDGEVKLAEELHEVCNYWKEKLYDIFALDLKRGKPYRKPKIIRGNRDQWTKEGDIHKNYLSDVANFIATFIDFIENSTPLNKFDKSTCGRNLNRIDRWLKRTVNTAHANQTGEFMPAWDIIDGVSQDDIWQYPREELADLVRKKEILNKKSLAYLSSSLVQVFAVCHYLLDRCCFTIIQPTNEDWAFDMFQSLNATGTPLTAIETFKPMVVNTTDAEAEKTYKDSEAEISFSKIDKLFINTNSAAQKSKLANEFLTSFALAVEGKKLETHFSKQRKWLEEIYTDFDSYTKQEKFVNFFGNYAFFYKNVWTDYKGENGVSIPDISSHAEADLASLIILYLKESNHRMAITVLASVYNGVIDGKKDSIGDFVDACKLIGAFYTLWRSSDGNAGLDNVYRAFFRGEGDSIAAKNWKQQSYIDIKELKAFLQKKLEEKGIGTKDDWHKKAKNYLTYKTKSVCKFVLFATAHETIPDPAIPGLMKKGMSGTSPYLELKKWISEDFKTLEHIAPRENTASAWDDGLYTDQELFEHLGNLTLLPSKVNISISNKGWTEKYLYYQHLAEIDPQKQQELANKAKNKGIVLSDSTVKLLQNANHNEHIKSIVALGENGFWGANLVENRNERMLDILWQRINKWVF